MRAGPGIEDGKNLHQAARVPRTNWQNRAASVRTEQVRSGPISKTNDPINCANACHRREEISARGRKNLPLRHELPAAGVRAECKKPRFHWVSHHGTALAQMSGLSLWPRH